MQRPHLEVVTDAGTFVVEVHSDTAPNTVAYVLDLVDRAAYDGSGFYRSTTLGRDRKPLIQGGPWAEVMCGVTDVGPDIDLLEHFETTRTSGASHVAGTVSLARDLFRTGNGLPEWFICLDDYPDLDEGGRTEPDDRGFPVFGTVTAGLDVVEAIAAKPTGAPTPIDRLVGEVLVEPVTIVSIAVVD